MGLGMRREIEPPGSENRLRSVGEDTERFQRWERRGRSRRPHREGERVLGPWQEVKIRGPELEAQP